MEELKKAISIYEKLKKEESKAHAAAREATEKESNAWDAWKCERKSLFDKAQDENHINAMAASKEASKARTAEKIATLAARAASLNVVYAAYNVLAAAIEANPAKFKDPVYFKKFKSAVAASFGELSNEFYTTHSYYSIYINYRSGEYGASETYFNTSETEGGPINLDKYPLHRKMILSEKEIKAEARQAAKDAEKIDKIQKDAAIKADAIRDKYRSPEVKNKLPYISSYIGSAGNNPNFF